MKKKIQHIPNQLEDELKVKKILNKKAKKVQNRFEKLRKYGNKAHAHTDLLLSSFVCTVIFLIFSLIILFSINFITNGNYYVSTSYFYNEFVTHGTDKIQEANFNFGIYHYIFYIKPVAGNSYTALLSGTPADIAVIIGTYKGPLVNWYGILYICFEAFLLLFVSTSFAYFSYYNKFLKYSKQGGARTRRYFNAFYSLIIVAIVFGGFLTEINVIPGSALVEDLILKFAPQYHYPAIKNEQSSTSSSNISGEINKYLGYLQTNGTGFSIPVALFGMVHISIVKEANINSGQESFAFKIYSPWWAYLVLLLHLLFVTIMSILLPFLFKNYQKHKQVSNSLVNNEKIKEIFVNNSSLNIN